MNIVSIARDLAASAHRGQVRAGAAAMPLHQHYEEVAALVADNGGGEEEIAAGILHDTVEDTELTLAEIAARTSPVVAFLVDGLTDPVDFAALPLAERKRLQAERVRDKDPRVKLVKVSDQTSNLRRLLVDPDVDWDAAMCMAYANGAKAVVDACRSECPARLLAEFDAAYAALEAVYGESARLAR